MASSRRCLRKHDKFVLPRPQPWCGHVERLLRAEVPEAAECVTVHPHRAFAPTTRVQKGVANLLQFELSAIEGRTGRRIASRRELHLREIVHGQGKDLPVR